MTAWGVPDAGGAAMALAAVLFLVWLQGTWKVPTL